MAKKRTLRSNMQWHDEETEKAAKKPKQREIVRVELPAFLKTVEIAKSTLRYLIQHYGGQLKSIQEWQAVVKGITSNPVT